jgi:hypothetical protein
LYTAAVADCQRENVEIVIETEENASGNGEENVHLLGSARMMDGGDRVRER